MKKRGQTRERFIKTTGALAGAAAAAGPRLAAPAVVRAQAAPPAVPRNRTFAVMFGGVAGQWTEVGIGNPYAVGASHQMGNNLLWEPLYYYSAFADDMIPWLATGETWNEDFTQLTVYIRQGVTWQDGMPFTANDVAFTINMLKENAPRLSWSADVRDYVARCAALDDFTVEFTFYKPNPRFLFDYLTFKFDTGIKIVSAHVFRDAGDPTSFAFFDLAKGWPFGTGAYRVALWDGTQKFMDRRDDWWAAQTGFAKLPQVERVLYLPYSDDNRASQLLITNQLDSALDLRPGTIKQVLLQNKKIISHSFDRPPYGYVDWWPNSLWFNTEADPYNDPDVRWAISYAVNRQQLIDVAYEGAGQATRLPYPDYPGLRPYFDSISDLLREYDTNKYDLSQTNRLMQGKGWTKDREGFWTKAGKRFQMDLFGAGAIHADIGPIITEQLRRGGFDTSFSIPTDVGTRRANGDAKAFITGHGASIADPYFTLRLFHGSNYRPTGENVPGGALSRWRNSQYDAIVDEMSAVPMRDQRLLELFRGAMSIWLKELPNAPLIQWFHRIPMNQTYWTGYPTVLNSYLNGAFWHLTFPLMLQRLETVQ
ncbi:MAG TPA: ABC transporter substrate-binding protein [Chloroflexota bacterium]|nr:ABC transporter substrate-binding protein [Chloroflexota bacterium]